MLFGDDLDDDDKTLIMGVPIAPDVDMQRERANGEYVSLLRNVAVDYPTLDHETTLRDQLITASCRHAAFPTAAMLRMAEVERERRTILKGGGGLKPAPELTTPAASRQQKMTYMDIHTLAHKEDGRRIDAASIALDEADHDTVFKGPPHLYREPRVTTKLSVAFLHNKVNPSTFAGIPTTSRPLPLGKRPMTSASTEYAMERARRDCRKSLEDLLQRCEQNNATFVDADFFLGVRSNLYPVGSGSDSRVEEPRDVNRVTEMFANVPLIDSEISANEPLQWMTATGCHSTHIVAALSALTLTNQGRRELESLFVFIPSDDCPDATSFFAKHKFIGVLLYVDGSWEWNIVDDLIATTAPGQPCFLRITSSHKMLILQSNFEPLASSSDKGPRSQQRFKPTLENYLFGEDDPVEVWPYIIHKAFAKMFGCVDAVDGGVPRQALRMLTGREVIGVPIDPAMPSGYFAELVEKRSALIWMLNSQPTGAAAALRDDQTGCAFLDNLREADPAWIPTDLPLIVEECFHNHSEGSFVIRLRSPWGCLRRSGESTVDLRWEEVLRYFSYLEIGASKSVEELHHVEAFNVSPAPVDGGTINGNAPPTSTHPPTPLSHPGAIGVQYCLRLNSPLPAPTTITLLQSNPKAHKALPYSMRKGIPFAALGLRVVSEASGQTLYMSKSAHVDEELTIDIVLDPGVYIITPFFYNSPKIPFGIRAAASSLTNLRLWPLGLNPDVHGVSTPTQQTQTIESLVNSPIQNTSPRHEPPKTKISTAATAAFKRVDLLNKGVLSARAAQQAAFLYFLSNTEEGRKMTGLFEENGDKNVSETDFSKMMQQAFP